jgi:hypothetical protein
MVSVRFTAVTQVAGDFATGTLLSAIETEFAEAGVAEVFPEIVSGVVVAVAFVVEAESVEEAEESAREILLRTSLEPLGPLKMGGLAAV